MNKPTTQKPNNRFSSLILGAWGLGKSAFAGSAAKAGLRTRLLITEPKEASSWAYRHIAAEDREEFYDPFWIRNGEGDALVRLKAHIWELHEDDKYDCVVLDDTTSLELLLHHEILKPLGLRDIGGVEDTRAFYGAKKQAAAGFYDALNGLSTSAAKRPKYVIAVGHTQPAKEDELVKIAPQQYITRTSADHRAEGVEYEGKVLMAMEGQLRRTIPKSFLNVVFADVAYEWDAKEKRKKPRYRIQLEPDEEKHAKIAAGVPKQKYCDNEWKAFLSAIGL